MAEGKGGFVTANSTSHNHTSYGSKDKFPCQNPAEKSGSLQYLGKYRDSEAPYLGKYRDSEAPYLGKYRDSEAP